ncbi:iron-containing alcohol dehydrogenase [Liquorilactobacillus satsumensis]|uniref:iron-containing alcohol dehydrogenase n=1 Tax=Liquorilactobacillus satsumensis TaxID=259059 RepID=UPI0021C4A47B|nr:iron-containing alcohol dehydrogenase [Liquorilactobacillus satsumensis]MCP9311949.1 iron-containing alcohol dehydrogenase [Liquorilactobacillus satsumensis]MCP9359082.1 iron-containing alcohol dehydrogenase [Liquorilactobacillus satsumensis]
MGSFTIKPVIKTAANLTAFFAQIKVTPQDVILTNKYILEPHISLADLPVDTIFLEEYLTGEPTDAAADRLLERLNQKDYQRVIAIGGGSVIDNSKLLVYGSDLKIAEIAEKGSRLPKKRQLIIVPTTTGTGSEVTNVAVFNFLQKKTKMGLAFDQMYADQVYLISQLAATMPYKVFATSSIDALVHSIESYISPKATAFSKSFSVTALKLILTGYTKMIFANTTGKTPQGQALQSFLEASTLAGVAFGNAGCGAVHALAYPIGSEYHIAHGQSNYLVFGGTFKKYTELGADLSEIEALLAVELNVAPQEVWTRLEQTIDQILPNQPLSQIGMNQDKCREFAKSVITNQQRLLVNAPLKLSEDDISAIYESLL